MARIDTLGNFLTDVAAAIRTKKGSEELIAAEDFDTEIENLPSGGGDLSEYFNNTISENRTERIQWDYLKKLPDLIVANNVTQLSYLFDSNYFVVNGKSLQNKIPKVICGGNVTSMSYMYASYQYDNYVINIDLSGLDTSNVTDMGYMFYNRKGLTSLDLSNFDFSKVIKINHMFDSCSNLLELDLSNFRGEMLAGSFTLNTSFSGCSKITKIDLSNLSPTGIMDARGMFQNCYNLEEIYLDKWDLGTDSTKSQNMFNGCGTSLTDGAVTKVYVKDAAAQNWVLTASNGHPSTWTTDNVIIAGSTADLRNA